MEDKKGNKVKAIFIATAAMLAVISMMPVIANAQTNISIGDASAPYCNTTTIPILITVTDPTGLGAATINLTYNPNVCVVTNVVKGPSSFDSLTSSHPYTNTSGYVRMVASQTGATGVGPGLVNFADITFHANGTAGSSTNLNLNIETLKNNTGAAIPYTVSNGTFTVTSATISGIFDTGAPTNPYPSIFGTHNGTITPNQTITVSMLYTYPCAGTGGHTGYARIWNNSGLDVTAAWNGYRGDWHNISFSTPFTLEANKTYNYTIRTGSYPQIHHTDNLEVANGMGTITCNKFIDANGRIYYDGIPAIKLFL